jgi:hypothetical protein
MSTFVTSSAAVLSGDARHGSSDSSARFSIRQRLRRHASWLPWWLLTGRTRSLVYATVLYALVLSLLAVALYGVEALPWRRIALFSSQADRNVASTAAAASSADASGSAVSVPASAATVVAASGATAAPAAAEATPCSPVRSFKVSGSAALGTKSVLSGSGQASVSAKQAANFSAAASGQVAGTASGAASAVLPFQDAPRPCVCGPSRAFVEEGQGVKSEAVDEASASASAAAVAAAQVAASAQGEASANASVSASEAATASGMIRARSRNALAGSVKAAGSVSCATSTAVPGRSAGAVAVATAPSAVSPVPAPAPAPASASASASAASRARAEATAGTSLPLSGQLHDILKRLLLLAPLAWLLHREARRSWWLWAGTRQVELTDLRRGGCHDLGMSLLPSQRDVVRQCLARIRDGSRRGTSVLVGLRAVWGGGKTTVMYALKRELREQTEFVPVYLNAWRAETAEELHFHVVQTIVTNPAIWPWAAPFMSRRLLCRIAAGRQFHSPNWLERLQKLKWRVSLDSKGSDNKVGAELSGEHLVATPLDFQDDLRRCLQVLRSHGREVVLLVDEIERGTHLSAQAMLVLLRRSLDLPGMHVVMPYVPEVLDALVFEPLALRSPELDATAMAVMTGHARLRKQAFERLARSEQRQRKSRRDPGKAAESADTAHGAELRRALLTEYMLISDIERSRLLRRMREKYTGASIDVTSGSPKDLVYFLLNRPWWRTANVSKVLTDCVLAAGGTAPEVESTERQNAVREAVETWCAAVAGYRDTAMAPGADRRDSEGVLNTQQPLVRKLAQWLESSKGSQVPALVFASGYFSWRTFEGQLDRMLNHWSAKQQELQNALRMQPFWVDTAPLSQVVEELIMELLCSLIIAALGLTYLELRSAPTEVEA